MDKLIENMENKRKIMEEFIVKSAVIYNNMPPEIKIEIPQKVNVDKIVLDYSKFDEKKLVEYAISLGIIANIKDKKKTTLDKINKYFWK